MSRAAARCTTSMSTTVKIALAGGPERTDSTTALSRPSSNCDSKKLLPLLLGRSFGHPQAPRMWHSGLYSLEQYGRNSSDNNNGGCIQRQPTEIPGRPSTVHANAAYSLADAAAFRQLDSQSLMMIDSCWRARHTEKLDNSSASCDTPLCADEVRPVDTGAASLIQNEAARIDDIKVQRVGDRSERGSGAGYSASCSGCWVGTMPQLGVALTRVCILRRSRVHIPHRH